jgi:hypothetical protein
MPPIKIEKIDDKTFVVTIEAKKVTKHTVTITPGYYHKMTKGASPYEKLITKAFEFLLEREPNTAILKEFDLPAIKRYYPEFERSVLDKL